MLYLVSSFRDIKNQIKLSDLKWKEESRKWIQFV